MRISSDMFYNHITQGLNDNLNELDKLSTQISTGKKMSKISDDVLGTLKSMDYKLTISQNNQSEQNITAAYNYLSYNDTIMTQISDTLVNLKKVTILSGGTTEDRTFNASQAATLRDSLLDLSNSTYLNGTIYSGSLSDQPAYVYDSTNHVYVYQGDSQQMSVSLGSGITLKDLNIVGNSTDAKILSPFHYALSAVATLTLPNGNTATFTPDIVTNPNSTTINVQITDPSSNVLDTFSFSNVLDVANLISYAWQNQEVDGATALTSQQSTDRIDALADVLDKIQSQVLTIQGQIGINQVQLNDQKTKLEANTTTQQNNLSTVEDADMDQTIVSLQKISTALNALRSASAKILSQSLFDFLQ